METTIQKTNDSILSVIIGFIITLFALFAMFNVTHVVPAARTTTNTSVMQWSCDSSGWTVGWNE